MRNQAPTAQAKRPTIRTVAAAAQVSTATVSRVMSGAPNVNPELAQRVRRIAGELGYRPNEVARGLAMGGLRNVGVLMPDLRNAYFHDVVKSMHEVAAQSGFRILIADHSGDPDDEFATAWDLLGHVDGMALLASRVTPPRLKDLARQETPVVLVNRVELGVELPMVGVDGFTAALELCGYLAELGHRRIAYLSGSALAWQDQERWRAIGTARFLGIEATRIECDGSIDSSYHAVDAALESDPTALVCFNDLAAIGAISRLRELGRDVPGEISVTGFDDIEVGRHLFPSLTTVNSPREELGRRAWALLQDAMAGSPITEMATLLPAALVKRQSAGPVRAG